MSTDTQWRAQFDAEITFGNGGALQTQEFRLDVPRNDITETELGRLLVTHLGLLMVAEVQVSNVSFIREAHKGSRGVGETGGGADRRRVVELSHVITDGMVTMPGLPVPRITDHLSWNDSDQIYSPGTRFRIARIDMVANTGTYLDTPAHRYPEGADLAALPVAATADIEGVVIRLTGQKSRRIEPAALAVHDVAGKAVLIHTGWDTRWGGEAYFSDHPHLSWAAADWLVEQNAALVGIDSLNIDGTGDGTRPAHTALLAADIPIVEHLCGLEQLPPNGFRFHAAPAAVAGMGTFPVRAYAVIG